MPEPAPFPEPDSLDWERENGFILPPGGPREIRLAALSENFWKEEFNDPCALTDETAQEVSPAAA